MKIFAVTMKAIDQSWKEATKCPLTYFVFFLRIRSGTFALLPPVTATTLLLLALEENEPGAAFLDSIPCPSWTTSAPAKDKHNNHSKEINVLDEGGKFTEKRHTDALQPVLVAPLPNQVVKHGVAKPSDRFVLIGMPLNSVYHWGLSTVGVEDFSFPL